MKGMKRLLPKLLQTHPELLPRLCPQAAGILCLSTGKIGGVEGRSEAPTLKPPSHFSVRERRDSHDSAGIYQG